MAEKGYDELVRDLRALGRGADLPGASRHLVTTVMERVSAAPEPGRLSPWTPLLDLVAQRVGSWRRRVALAGAAVLLAVLATPPVRAAVTGWFGFGGVMVQPGAPEVGSAAPPPEVATGTSMVDAAASVGFAVSVPTELGVPDGVEVSPDRRVVSMSWTTDEAGVLLLEQFDARLDFTVAKQVPEVRYAAVDRSDALWFEEPHEVTLLEADGSAITYNPRLAGHTLVWQDGSTSLASLVGTGGEVHRVDRSGRSHESGPE